MHDDVPMSFEVRSVQLNINPYTLATKKFTEAHWLGYKRHIVIDITLNRNIQTIDDTEITKITVIIN